MVSGVLLRTLEAEEEVTENEKTAFEEWYGEQEDMGFRVERAIADLGGNPEYVRLWLEAAFAKGYAEGEDMGWDRGWDQCVAHYGIVEEPETI